MKSENSSTVPVRPLEKLTGEIRRVRFENPESGFAVLVVKPESGRELPVCGSLAGLHAGQCIEVEGFYGEHAEFGREFRAERYRIALPGTPEGLKRFLGSAVPGIGPKTAALLVDHFGRDIVKVLDHYPRRLQEIPGIGRKKGADIARVWRETAARRDGMIFLQSLGITPAYCSRLFKRYGDKAPEVVRANPYRLAEEVDGIGFLRADAIATAMGFDPDSDERQTAAAVFALNTMVGSGHVCAPEETLAAAAAELTGRGEDAARRGIARALERRLLVRLDGMIYTPLLAAAETELPKLVLRLAAARSSVPGRYRRIGSAGGLKLAAEQQQAVDAVGGAPLSIITGGPGVGKTTVVGEIVRRARLANLRIALAAPTGRAAKRLSEATGLPARTIHRLLNFDPALGRFAHDRVHPLGCDLLIVDESSMLDILLAQALFRAVRPGTAVVLVGDRDQLPSVGPGTVFKDLIGSGFFTVTRLTRVFRQSEASRIILNAHRVNQGLLPEPPPRSGEGGLADFYWLEQDDPARAAAIIAELVTNRIPVRFGLDPVEEIQVLTPMNRGICGATALNELLAARLNGGERAGFTLGERVFKEGDKVMQTANNYDKQVFNGDLGRLEQVYNSRRRFVVAFDGGRRVEYGFDEAVQLVRAYAITVHKSQGCEFPAVVVPLLTQHYMMLQRNLLYTAMTRARKLLILIGSRRAVEIAVRNTRLEPRNSRLAARLAAEKVGD